MKKLFALILTIIVCLSFAACGDKKAAETTTASEEKAVETAETTTVSEEKTEDKQKTDENSEVLSEKTLYLDETVTIGDYEITVTGTKFTYGWNPNTYVSFSNSPKGSIHFIINYTVKNVGKSEIRVPSGLFTVNYDDGYKFEEAGGGESYYYSYDTDSFVANGNELPPLSKEIECKTCIDVSEQIKDDVEKSLKIELNLNDEKYIINLRPQDEKQKEFFYNKAVSELNEKNYKSAVDKFKAADDYSDAKAKYEEALALYYIDYPYTDEAKEYLNKSRENFELLNGSDISGFIIGEWKSTTSYEPIKFESDGIIDNQYTTNGRWKVIGDKIEIYENLSNPPALYEVRTDKNGKYFFFTDSEFGFIIEK